MCPKLLSFILIFSSNAIHNKKDNLKIKIKLVLIWQKSQLQHQPRGAKEPTFS
jgi:hypothetical protein